MFTGIVSGCYKIINVERGNDALHFTVDLPNELILGLKRGASVSIDGVCLTAVTIEDTHVSFDVMGETLQKTTLDQIQANDNVNVERSYRVGDEIGGHILSGHVMDSVEIVKCKKADGNQEITIKCLPEFMKYILPKGFIALDGVSLTVCECDPKGYFTINLIPETLRITTFGFKKEGDHINLEVDSQTQAIVETVERVLSESDGS